MKYPKTLHLPYSPGLTRGDKIINTLSHLRGREVVVTEKLDGENTCFEHDKVHARSENSRPHPSQNPIKALHAKIKHLIPEDIAVYGENMYAKHSIDYSDLDEYFYVFAIFDKKNSAFYSWKMTELLAKEYGLKTVPVIYKGIYKTRFDIPPKSAYGTECEGFVVRLAGPVFIEDFDKCVAKYVRADHVQTDEHWTRNWVPNSRWRKK